MTLLCQTSLPLARSLTNAVAPLGPGEALYIPALFSSRFVTSKCPEFGDMSIVSMFWRCLPEQEHDAGLVWKQRPQQPASIRVGSSSWAAISQLPEPQVVLREEDYQTVNEQLG